MRESSDHELTVFSAARQLPPERLGAFMDDVCAGDADLRRRVEELRESGPKAAAFLETPAGNVMQAHALTGATSVPCEQVGDRIGPYMPRAMCMWRTAATRRSAG